MDHPEGRLIVEKSRLRMRILMAVTVPNSHMNEIFPHLVNKNLFRPTSEIFTFNPGTKTT